MEIVLEASNSHVLENEHGDADDFLEIDIDLPHGFTDEDDMIEDAPQITGMNLPDGGASFDNADDYMLDDEHQEELSYETNDELMYEEEGETEAPSHSYVNVEDPIFPTFVDSTTPRSNTRESNVQMFEQDGSAALTTTSVSLDTTRSGSPLPTNGQKSPADDSRNQVHEEGTTGAMHDSHEQEEYENLSYHGEENEEDGVVETVQREEWDEHYTDGANGEALDPDHDSATPEELGIHDEPGLRQIKVWYQNTAYQLFDNGSGDPDQYFLDDLWLSVAPIQAVLQGISQVISGELADDEEICLHFREFGLEIEEVLCDCAYLVRKMLTVYQSTCKDVTISLAVILSMHKRFIENGSPEDLDRAYEEKPLCIYLATRARFEDRFEKLYNGAAEKKSLTDTLARHESESPEANENAEHEDESIKVEGVVDEEDNQQSVNTSDATARDKPVVADGESGTDNNEKVEAGVDAQQYEGGQSHVEHDEQTESNELYADADEAGTGNENDDFENHAKDENVTEVASTVVLDELAVPASQGHKLQLAESANPEQCESNNSTTTDDIGSTASNKDASDDVERDTGTIAADQSPRSTKSDAAKNVSQNQDVVEELEDWEEDFQELAQNSHVANHSNGINHFIPPCNLPQSCVCPDCVERIRSEYAKLNEQMNCRPLAHSAELHSLVESENDIEHTQFELSDYGDTNSSYPDDNESSYHAEEHAYGEAFVQPDNTLNGATPHDDHQEEGTFNDSFVSAVDETDTNNAVDINPPIDNDEIDFGLDDEEARDGEPETTTVLGNEEIPIAWSSAAHSKTQQNQLEVDQVDNSVSTGTLSANGEDELKVDEDEITYDDDDVEPDLRTPLKTEFATASTKDASAKRSWEEAEDEHDPSASTVVGMLLTHSDKKRRY